MATPLIMPRMRSTRTATPLRMRLNHALGNVSAGMAFTHARGTRCGNRAHRMLMAGATEGRADEIDV